MGRLLHEHQKKTLARFEPEWTQSGLVRDNHCPIYISKLSLINQHELVVTCLEIVILRLFLVPIIEEFLFKKKNLKTQQTK